MPHLELAVAVPSFIGSLTSCLATTIFGVLYFIYPPERHFRQALVVNLLLADWINSLNNTISGGIALSERHREDYFTAGAACTTNGWIGQFSVQAIDFNILIISITVLITVRKNRFQFQPSWLKTLSVCAIPWLFPLITSNIALGLHGYGPVSGNWCWIKKDRQDLRWGLTHGWRVAIFIVTVSIYTYVYIYLARHYRGVSSVGSQASERELHSSSEQELSRMGNSKEDDKKTLIQTTCAPASPNHNTTGRIKKTPDLRKMLLLNGYPLLYILLWLPGMANRVHEAATGWSPEWLVAMQSCTQFVGLGNAITYALNEQFRGRIRDRS
ncbi:uncharacterized protein RCC_04460 [Ramularia collo-cygni]|uniref:Glucose receptor Git3-like N-terminal domain-containing protein n=1 Tax=Ramularia collo-cygni TaxID=112498 RepID=A0A2D3V503_9PEZI|nr:uncharacterized protein RCC_04460 [Ramularia collo-cygni]CZT18616.1 uncharacterized protein RCC_04460 [Ramularia collo-cygni]